MSFPQWYEQATEDIDAAMFSGDFFYVEENYDNFKELLERWNRRLEEIKLSIDDEENNP